MGRTSYDLDRQSAMKKRTMVSALLIFIAIPLTIALGTVVFNGARYMIISIAVLIYTMLPFFMVFEKRKPKAREIVLIAMMTAITVCAHLLLHVIVPIQIGTALVIIAGISMGPEAGFLVGTMTRFVCNFYMGQGPWTPWQMFCWGLLGFLAGLAFNKAEPMRTKGAEMLFNAQELESRAETSKERKFSVVMGPVLCIAFTEVIAYISFIFVPGADETFGGWRIYVFGAVGLLLGLIFQRKRLPVDNITITVFTFVTTLIIYGGIINICAMFTSAGIPGGNDISFNTLRLLYVSGLPFDISHAATASLCIFVMGNPMIRKIERIKIKYGIYR